MDETKKYYETAIIVQQATTEDGEIIGLLLDNGKTVNIPKWEAELLITDQPTDPVDARNLRGNYVAGKVLELLLSLNVKVDELKFYLRKVDDSIWDVHFGSFNKMLDLMLKLSTSGLVDDQKELRMSHMDAILVGLSPKEEPKV